MRIRALFIRINKQMIRDRRTLALLLLAPLFVLTLMHFIFAGDAVVPRLGTVGVADNLVTELEQSDIEVITYDQADKDTVIEDDLDGLLIVTDESTSLILENSDPSIAQTLKMKIYVVTSSHLLASVSSQLGMEIDNTNVSEEYVYGSGNTNLFDTISPIMIGFFVFFFVFLIAGIGLLRERMTGTLERLMSTPVQRVEVVLGYLFGYGVFAILQTLVIIFFSVQILGVTMVGSIWLVILTNTIVALVALSLGILLSTFANSEFQMMQFIPIVIIPQIFFSGIFSIEGMATWLQVFGKCMPMYYAADALKGVMYKGYNLEEIAMDLLILCGFAATFILLNVFALKKYRRL